MPNLESSEVFAMRRMYDALVAGGMTPKEASAEVGEFMDLFVEKKAELDPALRGELDQFTAYMREGR